MNWLNKSATINTESQSASGIGHFMLDLGGLIPGIGEAADLTNAIWYAKSGQYLYAALSLISMIPTIGDAVGKGGKFGMWLTKTAPKGSAAAVKYGPKISKMKTTIRSSQGPINAIIGKMQQNPKMAPYAGQIKGALNAFLAEPDPVQGPQTPATPAAPAATAQGAQTPAALPGTGTGTAAV